MNKKRRSVIVSLERNSNAELKIRLDDLIQSDEDANKWIRDVIYTSKSYDVSTFENLDFDEKEMADFGYSIIARLHAFYKGGEI